MSLHGHGLSVTALVFLFLVTHSNSSHTHTYIREKIMIVSYKNTFLLKIWYKLFYSCWVLWLIQKDGKGLPLVYLTTIICDFLLLQCCVCVWVVSQLVYINAMWSERKKQMTEWRMNYTMNDINFIHVRKTCILHATVLLCFQMSTTKQQ
jgi:uncharacterized membrane protein